MTPPMTARKTSSVASSVTRRPASKRLAHAEALQPLGEALAAAVDDDDGPPPPLLDDLAQDVLLLDDGRAAELDDDRAARPGRGARGSGACCAHVE